MMPEISFFDDKRVIEEDEKIDEWVGLLFFVFFFFLFFPLTSNNEKTKNHDSIIAPWKITRGEKKEGEI